MTNIMSPSSLHSCEQDPVVDAAEFLDGFGKAQIISSMAHFGE